LICERCGQRDAVVNYIDIEDGIKHNQWLCEPCAADVGLELPGHAAPEPEELAPGGKGGALQGFLGGALAAVAETTGTGPGPAELVCPACHYTFVQVQNSGLLGCPECYTVFREYLLPILRRYHRATTHLGKAPRVRGARSELRLEIARLRHSLEAAVSLEDYEEAARLRDLIRDRELELARSGRAADEQEP
jgi:protein arginine kinase activator